MWLTAVGSSGLLWNTVQGLTLFKEFTNSEDEIPLPNNRSDIVCVLDETAARVL
jgi:hypothetical protein